MIGVDLEDMIWLLIDVIYDLNFEENWLRLWRRIWSIIRIRLKDSYVNNNISDGTNKRRKKGI